MSTAKYWFTSFENGKIDRSKLESTVNAELTDEMVKSESERLRRFGRPTSFKFLYSGPIGGAMGYDFMIEFASGKVIESVAFDSRGLIAGIDFRIFVPEHS